MTCYSYYAALVKLMHDGVNLQSSCDAIHAFIREITLATSSYIFNHQLYKES